MRAQELDLKSKRNNDLGMFIILLVISVGLIAISPFNFLTRLSAENKELVNTLNLDEYVTKNSVSQTDPVTQNSEIKPELVTKTISYQRSNKIAPGANFLMIGDSMFQWGLGSEIENKLLSLNGKVYREAIQSTGLLHPERLDWYNRLDQLLSANNYDVVILSFGLNDTDFVMENGAIYQFAQPGWNEAYQRKVASMLYKLLVQYKVKKVVWVGLPVTKTQYWTSVATRMNSIFKAEVDKYVNAVFIDTYARLAENGGYSEYATDDSGYRAVARQGDGIHVNLFGGRVLADLVITKLRENEVSF